MASTIKGSRSFRRILRAMPSVMRDQLVGELDRGGREILGAMQARAGRSRTGNLLRNLSLKLYPKSLRMRVGFVGKRANSRAFYARILEGGRRAQVVSVTRRKVAGSTLKDGRRVAHPAYSLRVTPLPARRFVYGPLTDLRAVFGRRMRGIWERALKAIGGGND